MSVAEIVRAGAPAPCRPWPGVRLDPPQWRAMAAALADSPDADLLALWADPHHVHALLRDGGRFLPVSVPTEAGFYPALSPARGGAAWFERMIRDLWGHHAEGGRDGRPWLDHGAWALHPPLSVRPAAVTGKPSPPEFAPYEGGHVVPFGPVLSGFAEPASVRITVAGDRMMRLEGRLGYAHKGTLNLMRGKSPRAAARFAARLAGDATVAHSIAFSRAAEAACGATAPPKAAALRSVMLELERIASHLLDMYGVAELLGWAATASALARLRDAVARAANTAFGNRLMMDAVVPGGVAADVTEDGVAALRAAAQEMTAALPPLARRAETDPLAGVGVLQTSVARSLAVGGVVGRASGRAFDLRREIAEPPYTTLLALEPDRAIAGDAAARVSLRIMEVGHSAALLADLLGGLPHGPLRVDLLPANGDGIGWAEGARGDVWHWMRVEGGQIAASFARDPGWLLWPALEAAAVGVALADLPLLVASFGATVSGMDL